MQIQIDSTPVLSMDPAEWRLLAERRVRLVMRRLRSEITRVKVRLINVSGPRGAVEQLCQLQLDTGAHGKMVISAVQANAGAALNAALRRAARTLRQLWPHHRPPLRVPLEVRLVCEPSVRR